MISFIIPAHNEQACLAGTLRAIHGAARATGEPYEIVVANDASTDATAEIATEHGARVVSVNNRQIAATRNSGGRAANGERLFFIDADTTINAVTVAAALRQMNKGAVGGGAPIMLGKDEAVPLYIRLVSRLSVIVSKLAGFTGGAFMFCTRDAFRATGGFNERLFWGEEGDFILALKRQGRFAVVWKPVLTSGRRFRTNSGLQLFGTCAKAVLFPRKTFTQRASVKKIWYDSNRERDDLMPTSLALRLSNGAALIIMMIFLTEPLWGFIPWSLTPLGSFLGTIRFMIATFICHIELLFWPLALILVVNLFRQKRLTSLIHSGAMIGFCTWQGWLATRGVIWIWTQLGHWMVG
jgi:glycosyltransferase involved in cell wall biosynthesis